MTTILQKYGLQVLIFLGSFFMPLAHVIGAVFVLVGLDMLTGIYSAKKSGEIIRSNKMKPTAIKFLFYTITIVASHLTELYLFPEISFVRIATSIVGVIELTSIYENVSNILGKNLIKRFKDFLDKKTQE